MCALVGFLYATVILVHGYEQDNNIICVQQH